MKSYKKRLIWIAVGIAYIGVIASFIIYLCIVYKILEARNWEPTPCTIISSSLKPRLDSYDLEMDILYEYFYMGKVYQSSRYDFFFLFRINDDERDQAIVDSLSPGKKILCFVNPRHPTEAVIERGFTNNILFGLIPIFFILLGIGVFYLICREKRLNKTKIAPQSLTNTEDNISKSTSDSPDIHDPFILEPICVPKMNRALLVGIPILILISACIFIFLSMTVKNWRNHRSFDEFECFVTFLTTILLVILGVRWIWGLIRNVISVYNPVPRVTVSSLSAQPGGTIEFQWKILVNTRPIRNLKIYFEGKEEYLTGQRSDAGDFPEKKSKNLLKTLVVETANPYEIASGRGCIQIPEDIVYSFSGENKKIFWVIHMIGEIRWWENIDYKFEISVLPRPQDITRK